MTTASEHEIDPRLDLLLERFVDVPSHLVWRAWTEPELLKQWVTPRPWKTVDCEIDARPGGIFKLTMQSPEGEVHDGAAGCVLEVAEGRRLVWTDAMQPGYRPASNDGRLMFTAIITIEQQGSGTRYTAIARHKDEETRKTHEEMGFHEGWGTMVDQLEELMKQG